MWSGGGLLVNLLRTMSSTLKADWLVLDRAIDISQVIVIIIRERTRLWTDWPGTSLPERVRMSNRQAPSFRDVEAAMKRRVWITCRWPNLLCS